MTRKLIVISGLPASGKTTLSLRLQKDLGIPLLTKDDIKEMLFECLPQRDRAWSTVQGKAAIAMLVAGAKELLRADSPLIIESYFHPEFAVKDIEELLRETGADMREVYCHVSHDERQRRWSARSRIARDPRHLDSPNAVLEDREDAAPLFIDKALRVDTGVALDEYEKKYQSVRATLAAWLKEEYE